MKTTACFLLALTLSARLAAADVIRYSFTGSIGTGSGNRSTLDLGLGPIDLSGAVFTVSGTLVDDLPEDDTTAIFAATSTYDFGALGQFTTDTGGDFYWQLAEDAAVGGVDYVGLINWYRGTIDFSGFMIQVAHQNADESTPQALGHLVAQETFDHSPPPRRWQNSAGQTLSLGGTFPMITIASADVTPVPEPGTLTLIGLGAAGLYARGRRRLGRRDGAESCGKRKVA
jgi:hypothetical protein